MSALCPCLQMSWLLAASSPVSPVSAVIDLAPGLGHHRRRGPAEHCVTPAQPGPVWLPLLTTHTSCLLWARACAAGSEFHFLPTLIKDRGAEKWQILKRLPNTMNSRFQRKRQKEIVCIFSNECLKMGDWIWPNLSREVAPWLQVNI